jgi:Fe-Mn family superoxide dismutase
MTLTRRQALSALGIGTFIAAARPTFARGGAAQPPAGPFSLPPLTYPHAALEPHIDTMTMEIHHGRHHQSFVNNLNAAAKSNPAITAKPIEALVADLNSVPEAVRTLVRNNGGGHLNHIQFWTLMAPKAGGPPTGAIADAINGTFGSFDKFKELFNQAANTRFGSGWAWLSDEKGKLVVHSTANQDHPSMEGRRAIFGLDVWEHAYYLKYQNRRPDYVTAWWNLINWAEVNKRLKG